MDFRLLILVSPPRVLLSLLLLPLLLPEPLLAKVTPYPSNKGAKAGSFAGQFPIPAWSLPILINCPTDGVGPSYRSQTHRSGLIVTKGHHQHRYIPGHALLDLVNCFYV